MMLFWISLFVAGSVALHVGHKCGSDKQGECVAFEFCPEAVKQVKESNRHNLERCSWLQHKEIVCCPKKGSPVHLPGKISGDVCNTYKNWTDPTHLVLNGKNVSEGVRSGSISEDKFAHMVALGFQKTTDEEIIWGGCAGTIISDYFVLTAAHCTISPDRWRPVKVRIGKLDLFGDSDGRAGQDISIAETIRNPNYKYIYKMHDIALLRLTEPIYYSETIRPACLHTQDDIPSELVTSEWCRTGATGKLSTHLVTADVQLVDLKSCNQTYASMTLDMPLLESHLCAISNSDTCKGDSGGLIQLKGDRAPVTIVGITTFGKTYGNSVPSVFTRVSRYLDWIEKIVWP